MSAYYCQNQTGWWFIPIGKFLPWEKKIKNYANVWPFNHFYQRLNFSFFIGKLWSILIELPRVLVSLIANCPKSNICRDDLTLRRRIEFNPRLNAKKWLEGNLKFLILSWRWNFKFLPSSEWILIFKQNR